MSHVLLVDFTNLTGRMSWSQVKQKECRKGIPVWRMSLDEPGKYHTWDRMYVTRGTGCMSYISGTEWMPKVGHENCNI